MKREVLSIKGHDQENGQHHHKLPNSNESKASCTVFVRGLPLDVEKETLMAVMKRFGPVRSCRIVVHPETCKSRGTAFVDFENAQDGQKAVRESELGR